MVDTTLTEERLKMSLPTDLRKLPAEEVIAGQTFRAGFSIGISGGSARGPGERKIAPPTFQSELLQQDFPSASARQKAEAKFRATRALELEVAQRLETTRLEDIRERTVGGQLRMGFTDFSRFGADVGTSSLIGVGPFGFRPEKQVSASSGVSIGIFDTGMSAILFGKQFIDDPGQTTKSVVSGIGSFIADPGPSLLRAVAFAKSKPGEFIGRLAGEIILFKGSGKAIKLAGRGVELGGTVISPSFRRVRTRDLTQFGTTESFIGNIGKIGATGEIALIPAGLKRGASTLRPSVRGGFGFTQAEQLALIKQKGPLVSSQANFPSSAFGKPLKKDFFTTPPFEGIGFARESRLGIIGQREATLSDIINLDFTFKKAKPQIIVFPERKGFNLKTTPGSELEVVAGMGQVPIKTGQPAVTIIRGRRVPIVTATFGKAPGGLDFRSISGGTGGISSGGARGGIGTISIETVDIFGRAKAGARVSAKEANRLRKETGFDIGEISGKLDTRPFVSTKRLGLSTGLSISGQFSSGLVFSARSFGFSFPARPTRTGRITPKADPFSTVSGIPSFRISPPARPPSGIGGGSGFLPGLALASPRLGAPVKVIKDTDRRKKKPKKPKKRKQPRFRVAPSFTAQALDIRGIFPKELISGAGLLPGQIRVLPRRRRKRK